MKIKEFFEKVEGDFDGAMSRLMKEERIEKFVKKLPKTEDMANLRKALEEKDWETAFRSSHSLKGMALNLGLTKLAEPSCALCENLRGGTPKEDCAPLMEKVEEEYKKHMDAISEIDD